MKKSKYSIKEKLLISLGFWPTLFIGVALGMAVSLLLIQNIQSIVQLFLTIKSSIIILTILGVVTRIISIYYWKKYNWSFTSDLK
jgi:asparagine N-glycosylation enzyme membrane subunit Stt3